ncbi:MAG: hypothetical protein MJB57_03655 [Gemmatimonadetes bacterium]|nr:hypothetical protein [Gemmatimonadota bacterium]
MSFYEEMGFIAYPLTVIGVLLVAQTMRCIVGVARSDAAEAGPLRIHSILILGVLGTCVGLLGTLVGVYLAASVMASVDQVDPQLAWGGLKVTLGSSIVGFLLLGFSSIVWLGLQYASHQREQVDG